MLFKLEKVLTIYLEMIRRKVRLYDQRIETLDLSFTMIIGNDPFDCYDKVTEEYLDFDTTLLGDAGYRVASAIQCESRRKSKRNDNYYTNFVLVLPKNSKGQLPRSIAHESIHLSWFILSHCGIEITRDNHEIQARLVEYIFETALSKIENRKAK